MLSHLARLWLLRITRAPLCALLMALVLALGAALPAAASAQPAQAAPPEAAPALDAQSINERLADLEAYVNNGARVAKASKIAGPGPGHNAWMMVSTALVLFMTLPGLALFYGGMVRTKNVLSVMAQCLGLAGLVTILWWAFGYSLVVGKDFGSGLFGGKEFFFFKGVDSAANTDDIYWVPH